MHTACVQSVSRDSGNNGVIRSRCELVCSRRHAVQALVLMGVSLATAACTEDAPTEPGVSDAVTVAGPLITIALSRLDGLRAPGSAYVLRAQSVIILRIAERDYRAFTNICTHSGCGISLFESGRMRCQCHGSEFDTEGKNVSGPAPLPLVQYASSLDAVTNTLTITKPS
jgi:cytochrome b6-f complex iron-sulfur subunit